MKIAKNKKASLIALFLVLTIAVTLVALPVTNAHTPAWNYPTWCYVSVSPNPIGINQQALIVFWINVVPPTASGAFGDRWTFTVDVTAPDGTNETLGPFTSDPVGGGYVQYTPTQLGTYTVVAHMAAHVITGLPTQTGLPPTSASVNDTYAASTSDAVYLTVQQEPIQAYQETPLPTRFWTRPINGINRDWYQVASNWLGADSAAHNVGPTTLFAYGLGPESAHIMWTRPYWSGGIMDTRFGDVAYYTGMSYEDFHDFTDKIILDGKLIYNVKDVPRYGWYAINLYTGETEYFQNTSAPITHVAGFDDSGEFETGHIDFGQIYYYDSPNQHGGLPYLWSTTAATPNTWMLFDGFTGNYICSIANVSSGGTAVYGKDGSILRYSISGTGANQYLRCWNTSQAIWWHGTQAMYQAQNYTGFSSNAYWMWRPYLNYTFDGSHGFSLNVSLAANPLTVTTIRAVREGEYIIGGSAGSNNEQGITPGYLWCLSLKPKEEGRLLWNRTFTPPSSAGNKTISAPTVDPEDGVFVFSNTQLRQRWGYSLETGQQLWGPTASESQWMYYGMGTSIYQGKLLSYGYGGILTAYNITTGEIMWNYTAGTLGFEQPYSGAQLSLGFIADGKIYLYSTEHSATVPLARGQYLRCINTTSGEELWKITCYGDEPIAADGYIVTVNLYDSQIYCFGKGPSATTVDAPQTVPTLGSSVMITGTVTDQCAGAKNLAQQLGFVNGVPAMSEADQQLWMEYLYMQRPMPTDAKGVEVSLDTIDPNGNYVHIGTVTSDSSGMFKKMFTPEVPGEYTIIATFAGSAAYYGSYAETTIGISEAPPATAPPEYPQPIDYTWSFVGTALAIIIAVAIATILLLRKRP